MNDTKTIDGDFEAVAIGKAYGAEQCKLLRAAYKKRGWSRTAIAVRNKSYSMGSSMSVEIKRPDLVIDFAEAERLANAGESIRRCEISGEILNGGNRFVSFGFSDEALVTIAAPFIEAATTALAKAEAGEEFEIHKVEGTVFTLNLDSGDLKIWNESGHAFSMNRHEEEAKSVAQQIGTRLFKAGRHPMQTAK